MTTNPATTAWRRLAASLIGAVAIVGGPTLLAPAAGAQPTEAQTECSEAGGDYSSESDAGGNTFEKCCYEGLISGVTHCDVWVNGKWNDDLSSHEEPTAPPSRPGPPPVAGTPERAPDEVAPVKPGTPPKLPTPPVKK